MHNQYTDIMIDIETLDTLPSAAIVQIGAVAFCLDNPGAGTSAIITLPVTPDLSKRSVSYSTVQFWLKQSDEARDAVFGVNGEPLDVALARLFSWYGSQGSVVRVWAMPPSFDITILEDAARSCSLEVPWRYNEARCVRTLGDLAGATKEDRIKPIIAHDAGYDALAQVQFVFKCRTMLSSKVAGHG